MNTSLRSSPRSAARSFARQTALALVTTAALGLAATAGAQTLLSDDFTGDALDASVWTLGSNGGLGTAAVSGGSLALDVNQETNSARTAIATDAHAFNPFSSALTVSLNNISLGGDPGTSFNSLYSVIGRLPTDVGGAANAGLAASYSAGGAYGTGGAFGISLLGFSSAYRLQILDSGSSATVQQTQVTLSGAPTDIVWTVDGTNSTWSATITGATFTGLLTNQLFTTIDNTTTISGSFSNFTEAGITSGEDIVSRLILGANNGTGVTDGAIANFGSVSVIPEPSAFALLTATFIGGVVATRRRRRN